jgi:hypothetical protein
MIRSISLRLWFRKPVLHIFFTVPMIVFSCSVGRINVAHTQDLDPVAASAPRWPLRVDQSGKYLVDQNGQPFFFLADTASRISHRLNREEVEFYLSKRAQQGFTTILMAAVRAAEEWQLPNPYGDQPFWNNDITQPAITPGNNPNDPTEYDWWDHIDYIIDTAAARGLTVALVPFAVSHSGFLHLNRDNAQGYGRFIGERYRNRSNIVWVLGWDNEPDNEEEQLIWNLMAKGITEGVAGSEDYSKTLMTFHTYGPSSIWFHNAPWLDFNMIETHIELDQVHPLISADKNLRPLKPTGIGEGWYERARNPQGVESNALTIRKEAYWSFLAGGYYIYGNMSIWHFGDEPPPLLHWATEIDTDSARQMTIFRNFVTSREWWNYLPDQNVFASGVSSGERLNAAARTVDGRSIIVYLSSPTAVSMRMNQISQGPVRAEMMNPATGEIHFIGTFPNSGTQQFTTPAGWEDAVLVLESTTR